MTTLNTNIPLMGQNVNYGNALAQGMQAGQQAYNARQSYEADQFKQANASGIMSGDPQALAGLAGYDLDAAQQARVGALNARTAEHKLSAAEAAQTAAELESVMRPLAVAYANGDQHMFEQALARHPEIKDQITWDNFEIIAAETQTIYDQLLEVQDANKPDYKFDEKTGRLVMIDPNDPRKSEVIELGSGTGDDPASVRELKWKADQLGLQEGTPEYQDFIRTGGEGTGVDTKDVDALRKEFIGSQAVKNFELQSSAFGRIVESARDPSPAGDLALVFNFMKVLDPGSVVRESEFATAESAAAWLQEQEQLGVRVPLPVASAIRRMQTGQRLSEEQRADFVGRAANLYKGAEEQHNIVRDQYARIAEERGYPLSQSIIDLRYQGEMPVLNPAPTTGAPEGVGPPVPGQTVDIDGGKYTVEEVK